ncbi:MAG: Hpt domain-containing protein, partial [Bdellovibrionota bacterium]
PFFSACLPVLPKGKSNPTEKRGGTMSQNKKRIIEVSEDILDLVPAYLEGRAKDIITLTSAIQSNDFATIGGIGHKLKGVAASYGFPDLSTIGIALEMAAENRKMDIISIQVKLMKAYLEEIEVVPEKAA